MLDPGTPKQKVLTGVKSYMIMNVHFIRRAEDGLFVGLEKPITVKFDRSSGDLFGEELW